MLKIHEENTQSEIKDYISKLEEEVSKYCGFQITFPLKTNRKEVIMDAQVKFPVKVPQLTEDIAMTILGPLSKILEMYEELDIKDIQTIARDLSLSFIFNGYIDMSASQQYDVIKIVNELKNIGEKTYENRPVDIGVIYCADEKILEQIQELNIDFILLPERKSINFFFLEEKPFLRLIDNKSLAVAINRNFEVFAIVRKKPGSKSLSSILESQYNEWAINNIKKTTSDYFAETLKGHISQIQSNDELQEELKNYLAKLFETTGRIKEKACPEYTYFSIQNKEVNIYTSQKFVISYNNGNWKLRHYNLMLGTIMFLIFTCVIDKVASLKVEEFESLLNDITVGILKLSDIIRMLSQNGSSSIFVIILKNYFSNKISLNDAKQKLKDNEFKNNNLKRNFLNVIHYDGYHVNIKDSDAYLVEALSSIDGAVVMDPYLNIISFGEIINVPSKKVYNDTFGTGTKAARYASRLGLAIKISEDGDINIFTQEKLLLKL